MGGFFSSPKPPPPPEDPLPDPEEAERERRLEAMERRRRGRASMIATSDRGVLDTHNRNANQAQTQKRLLGE